MLGTLAWPDFIQLVLAVLNGRGYERSFGGAGTEGEYLLERGGQNWLLSSRHSRAWKPGTTGIAEFASHLRQQGLERSEAHTSELQSLMRSSYAVICLKKKTQ